MEDNETTAKNTLKGKRIVLLGGTSGIGLAIARAAAENGANLVVVSSRQQSVERALATLPQGTEGYAVDLADEAQVESFFKKIGEFDHLVFTAGEKLQLMELPDTKLDKAREFFNLRYWGALTAVKYASPLIGREGSVTLTTGTVSKRPWKGWTVAASITGAVDALTRALAVELAPIRVNAVCPGIVETDLWGDVPEGDRKALFNDVGGKLLTRKIGKAEEVAEAYLYMIRGNYTTGQVTVVDGGGVLV